jgi:osmotically inducible protein OsmC
MPTRIANAEWQGDFKRGGGSVALGSGAFEGPYNFSGRFEDGAGTNPEELLAASHAACFTMAMNLFIGEAGHEAHGVETDAKVYLRRDDDGFTIHKIALSTVATVPGIDQDELDKIAAQAKDQCPLSKALASVPEITLEARLAD